MVPLLVSWACLAIELILVPGAFAWCMVDRANTAKRKESERNDISIAQKVEIVERFETCKGTKDAQHQQLADWFNLKHGTSLSRSTVSKLLKPDKIKEIKDSHAALDPKRAKTVNCLRPAQYPELEEGLMLWIERWEARNGKVDDATILEKARQHVEELQSRSEELKAKYEGCKLSEGWLHKFKTRHNLKCSALHGEAASADMGNVQLAKEAVSKILESGEWERANVYNFDETGLYFTRQPTRTISSQRRSGSKLAKERMTVGLAVNVDGTSKLKLVVIHKYQTPRAIKTGGIFRVANYVHWFFNKTAWMTTAVFSPMMQRYNTYFRQKRVQAVMFMDNAGSHQVEGGEEITVEGLKAIKLSHLTIVFLPPNVTSHVQPLDQGIIAAFKLRYRRQLVQWILATYGDDDDTTDLSKVKPDAKQAVLWIHKAWEELTCETVFNCWRKSQLLPASWLPDSTNSNAQAAEHDSSTQQQRSELASLIGLMGISEPLSVDEYISMPDEDEIEQELSAAEIVDIVVGGDAEAEEEPDEDAAAGPTLAAVSLPDARKAVSAMLSFATNNPELFSTAQVVQIQQLMDTTFKAQVANLAMKKQAGIRHFFAPAVRPAADSDGEAAAERDQAAVEEDEDADLMIIEPADAARAGSRASEQQQQAAVGDGIEVQDSEGDARDAERDVEGSDGEGGASRDGAGPAGGLAGLMDARWSGE